MLEGIDAQMASSNGAADSYTNIYTTWFGRIEDTGADIIGFNAKNLYTNKDANLKLNFKLLYIKESLAGIMTTQNETKDKSLLY